MRACAEPMHHEQAFTKAATTEVVVFVVLHAPRSPKTDQHHNGEISHDDHQVHDLESVENAHVCMSCLHGMKSRGQLVVGGAFKQGQSRGRISPN